MIRELVLPPAPLKRAPFQLAPLTLAILTLAACAEQPAYPVRPGEPRAEGLEMPRPAYPITAPADDRPPSSAPPAPLAPSPAPPDAPPYYKPQPIPTGAPDDAGYALRGRQSPGPAMAVRSAPPPALETPREVTVRPGESLFEVAERVRTPIRAIIDLNGLLPPYDVTPGQLLRIPPPVVYTVKPGDTLLTVARRFAMDPRSLANLNDIALETPLRPGQRLALPSMVHDSQAPARTAAYPSARPVDGPPAARPRPASPAGLAATSPAPASAPVALQPPPAPPEGAPPSADVVAAAGKGRFLWPVKGDILSGFGPKGPGQRNDGVNIAAEAGAPVRAAAAGQVVYAGNTIPGFGNLVVIKHSDGWTSLYGNLGKIAVKIRGEVTQGQELGVAGLSGAVDRPQVHFEVRYAATPQEKARPVDPQTLLP